jgi:hypothetical protein
MYTNATDTQEGTSKGGSPHRHRVQSVYTRVRSYNGRSLSATHVQENGGRVAGAVAAGKLVLLLVVVAAATASDAAV